MSRVVVFVAPYLLPATTRFVTAAASLPGVQTALVTAEPADRLPADLRFRLAGHWRVDDPLDPAQVAHAVTELNHRVGPVERLLAALEELQVPLARVREALGIPGMDVATAVNFRDKAQMKTVLRAAGVPCARHRLCTGRDDATTFAAEVGFPIVVKPPAGAGARATFRLDDDGQMHRWLEAAHLSPDDPALLEEFLTGEEGSFDSVTLGGRTVWYSVSHYLPPPLEVLRNPWMQWAVLLPRHVDGPEFAEIREVGPRALQALGLVNGLTHMEWFRRPDGSVAVSEVAVRPPGAQITSLLSYAHDVDMYQAWARLVATEEFDPPERRWAVGAAYLRGQGQGHVRAVHGLDEAQRQVGHLVMEARLPEPGAVTSSSYEGDGYVIVRDHETESVVAALKAVLSGVRVEVGG